MLISAHADRMTMLEHCWPLVVRARWPIVEKGDGPKVAQFFNY